VRNPVKGAQFQRDVKLAQKRGKDMAKLREAIRLLIEGSPLPPRYKDHPLGGDWKHFRDCHIGGHFGDSLLQTPARSPRALLAGFCAGQILR
jgi:addiction module RelE/StbE family toxin